MILVLVMVILVASVPSFSPVMISPGVAAQCHCESYQGDADHHEFACHFNLLRIGLNPDLCGLSNPYDGDAA